MSNVAEDGITLLCDLCEKPCFEGGGICEACMKGGEMTSQQILEQAIQKAIDGGWNILGNGKDSRWEVFINVPGACMLKVYDGNDYSHIYHPTNYIFNHDFAKALWGEEPEYTLETRDQYGSLTVNADTFMLSNWQYHLQQMVIADDPIRYLGEHLG